MAVALTRKNKFFIEKKHFADRQAHDRMGTGSFVGKASGRSGRKT
jgi:hypothetical protein